MENRTTSDRGRIREGGVVIYNTMQNLDSQHNTPIDRQASKEIERFTRQVDPIPKGEICQKMPLPFRSAKCVIEYLYVGKTIGRMFVHGVSEESGKNKTGRSRVYVTQCQCGNYTTRKQGTLMAHINNSNSTLECFTCNRARRKKSNQERNPVSKKQKKIIVDPDKHNPTVRGLLIASADLINYLHGSSKGTIDKKVSQLEFHVRKLL